MTTPSDKLDGAKGDKPLAYYCPWNGTFHRRAEITAEQAVSFTPLYEWPAVRPELGTNNAAGQKFPARGAQPMTTPSDKDRDEATLYCVYEEDVAKAISEVARSTHAAIVHAQDKYPGVEFGAMVSGVAHRAATIAHNAAVGKPLDRGWRTDPTPERAPLPELGTNNAAGQSEGTQDAGLPDAGRQEQADAAASGHAAVRPGGMVRLRTHDRG